MTLDLVCAVAVSCLAPAGPLITAPPAAGHARHVYTVGPATHRPLRLTQVQQPPVKPPGKEQLPTASPVPQADGTLNLESASATRGNHAWIKQWLDFAIDWFPRIFTLAGSGWLLVRALAVRRCLVFFCGRPWIRGKKDFRIVLALFEPDSDLNEQHNQRVVLVADGGRRILQPSGRCTLAPLADPLAPISLTREDGSKGELIPTASKAWVSHTAPPKGLDEDQLTDGRDGLLVSSSDGVIWRFAPAATYMDIQPRWQMLVPLLSPFLSWEDTNAAKAVDDVLPSRQVTTTYHSSIDFSRQLDIHSDPILLVGSPRSTPFLESLLEEREIEIAIDQDRVSERKERYVRIENERVCALTPEQPDERLAIVARFDRGQEQGVCTCVCGSSARITQLAGRHLATHWQQIWRSAQRKRADCRSFLAVFQVNRHADTLPVEPDVLLPLRERPPGGAEDEWRAAGDSRGTAST